MKQTQSEEKNHKGCLETQAMVLKDFTVSTISYSVLFSATAPAPGHDYHRPALPPRRVGCPRTCTTTTIRKPSAASAIVMKEQASLKRATLLC